MPIQLISYLQDTGFDLYNMREWLSGGAPPCQGGGRGFDPRLALEKRTIPNRYRSFFRALPGLESSMSTLRSGPRSPRSPGPRAPSRASFSCGYRPAPVDLLQMKLKSEMHQPLEEVVHFLNLFIFSQDVLHKPHLLL